MTTKYVDLVSGELVQKSTVSTSAGAGDADKIVSLNGSGILPSSIVNSVTASAGSGDSGKVVALDSSGRIDNTMMPTGVGADTASITASENISAGAFVNVFNNSGTPNVRNADASVGRRAHGFSIAGASTSASCTVYFTGRNTAVSSKTPGATQYLSGATPGASTETAPSTSTWISQQLGEAVTATEIEFVQGRPVTLA